MPKSLNHLLISHPEAILHIIDELDFHFRKRTNSLLLYLLAFCFNVFYTLGLCSVLKVFFSIFVFWRILYLLILVFTVLSLFHSGLVFVHFLLENYIQISFLEVFFQLLIITIKIIIIIYISGKFTFFCGTLLSLLGTDCFPDIHKSFTFCSSSSLILHLLPQLHVVH